MNIKIITINVLLFLLSLFLLIMCFFQVSTESLFFVDSFREDYLQGIAVPVADSSLLMICSIDEFPELDERSNNPFRPSSMIDDVPFVNSSSKDKHVHVDIEYDYPRKFYVDSGKFHCCFDETTLNANYKYIKGKLHECIDGKCVRKCVFAHDICKLPTMEQIKRDYEEEREYYGLPYCPTSCIIKDEDQQAIGLILYGIVYFATLLCDAYGLIDYENGVIDFSRNSNNSNTNN